MTKKMSDWFFMRNGFDTFLLQPEKHARYLFGERDRRQRDHLLQSLEEAAYSSDGHKAAVFGDYGRGKTHQCLNLVREISRQELGFIPVYVKCGAFKKKEPFSSLLRELIFRHSTQQLREVATEYARRVNSGDETPLADIVHSEDIGTVMNDGLAAPAPQAAKTSMRWLAGEKVDLGLIGGSLKPQLVDSGDFGAVMRGLSHMFVQVTGKVPLYIVDEAERFQNITDTDTYYGWLAALRELTEIRGIALLFMVAAKTRDELPTIFVQDEIIRRIGVANYIEFLNPGKDDLRAFLLEQLQTSIQKGALPATQAEIASPEAASTTVPPDLLEIVGSDASRLETFPFEPDAFDQFLTQISTGEMANKPSEAQIRLQKLAQKVMRLDRRTIDAVLVDSLETETFS